MRVLIVKTGETVAPLQGTRGDFEDWFRQGLGLSAEAAPMVRPHRGEPLPTLDEVEVAVITGSPAMVTDAAPWSIETENWIRHLADAGRWILGVCYGHQLLARAFGGAVTDHAEGSEVGTVEVQLTETAKGDPLLGGLPSPLIVQSSHRQVVSRLPRDARRLAFNDHDANQAFAIGERAWGVQFHPEFDADIIRGYLAHRADALGDEGIDVRARAAAARDSDHGVRILRRFVELAR